MNLFTTILLFAAFFGTLLAGLEITGRPKCHVGWLGVAAAVLAYLLVRLAK